MKLDKSMQTISIAALLVAAVAALPLASSPASAQITPSPDNNNSYSFDDGTMTSADRNDANGTSFLAVFGMSTVEGVEARGVVMNSEDEISVTVASENGTTTGESDPVTIVAFTGTMNMMMSSMLSSGSMASLMNDNSNSSRSFDDNNNIAPYNDNGGLDNSGGNLPRSFATADFGNSTNPMDLFENMKTGSAVLRQGWNSPETVTVTLVDNGTDTGTAPDDDKSDTSLVFVMILPYTQDNTAGTTIGEGQR